MIELTLWIAINGVKQEASKVSGLFHDLHDAAVKAGKKIGVEYDESKGHRVQYYLG